MRILLIRHGDPDYEHDTLTEKGHREAQALAEVAEKLEVGDCCISPLGRAQATAGYVLRKLGKTGETLDWLKEFPARVELDRSPELQKAYTDKKTDAVTGVCTADCAWDLLPSYWTEHPEYMDREKWRTSEVAVHSDLVELYDSVAQQFDELLAGYGYVREGMHYRVEHAQEVTVTFFCHFGISCVLLSHLWNVSPFLLWHSLAMAPTSVTEVVSEERERGTAYFRGLRIGDLTHLYLIDEKPSFSARFCETYENMEQRH